MKTVQIYTTGGTIEGLDYKDEINREHQKLVKIESILINASVSFDYIIESVFEKDSRAITEEDLNTLAKKVQSSKASKVLITHGTYTMLKTAKYLGTLKIDKTIVLTGAFILGSEPGSDASFNLGYALASLNYLENGVYIAINGKIFYYENVVKDIENNRFKEA